MKWCLRNKHGYYADDFNHGTGEIYTWSAEVFEIRRPDLLDKVLEKNPDVKLVRLVPGKRKSGHMVTVGKDSVTWWILPEPGMYELVPVK